MRKGMVTYGIILFVLLVFNIILFKENQLLKSQNLVLANNFDTLADRIFSLEQLLNAPLSYASDPGDGIVYAPEVKKCGEGKQKMSSREYSEGGNQGYITWGGAPTS
ncbi:MAG: hypothetical protein ISS27_01425 [Candidatus Omnitrophica bacterium]|nr:hypothetical protein [Candidatus Omnitrophota bacterium]